MLYASKVNNLREKVVFNNFKPISGFMITQLTFYFYSLVNLLHAGSSDQDVLNGVLTDYPILVLRKYSYVSSIDLMRRMKMSLLRK